MKHCIILLFQFLPFLAQHSWSESSLPTSSEVITAVGAESLDELINFIHRLEAANDPEAIFRLLEIYHWLKRMDGASKDIADRAMNVIRSKDNHAEVVAEKIRELSTKPSTFGRRQGLMASLRQIRTEQAVRVVGEFLYDDFSMPVYLFSDHSSDDGPNRRPAASTLINWLIDLEGYSDELRVSANAPPHTVLRGWWSARKDDPEFIRAVAEGLPLPPLREGEDEGAEANPMGNPEPPRVNPQGDEETTGASQSNHETRGNLMALFVGIAFSTALLFALLRWQKSGVR